MKAPAKKTPARPRKAVAAAARKIAQREAEAAAAAGPDMRTFEGKREHAAALFNSVGESIVKAREEIAQQQQNIVQWELAQRELAGRIQTLSELIDERDEDSEAAPAEEATAPDG